MFCLNDENNTLLFQMLRTVSYFFIHTVVICEIISSAQFVMTPSSEGTEKHLLDHFDGRNVSAEGFTSSADRNSTATRPSSGPTCPAPCTCSKFFHKINCERQHLSTIPNNIPVNATDLLLGYNTLSSLQKNAFFGLTALTTLSLKNNILGSIQPGAFSGLLNLRYLYLTDNILARLPSETFEGLSSLQKLYLSQNKLLKVPDVGLCTNLTDLGLENNQISNATIPSSFVNLTSFSRLTLNTNPIKRLTAKGFDHLRTLPLTKIELSGCDLSDVENGTFAGMTSLKSLTLSYNPKLSMANLQSIVDSLADTKLDSLDISASVQTEPHLPVTFFQGLQTVPLQKLLIKQHRLTLIPKGTFQYLPNVSFVDLSHGQLNLFVQDNTLSDLAHCLTLNMNNNHLVKIVPVGLPPALVYADFSHNKDITTITNQAFVTNARLRNLTLAYCGILTIQENAFLGLGSLVHLNLSHNGIGSTNIGVNTFEGMPSMTSLDLSHNQIKSIASEKDLFKYATELQFLDFSHNSLNNFSRQLFSVLVKLEHLDLSGNSLSKMIASDTEGVIFKNLSHLLLLDLSRSGLVTMPGSIFHGLTSLKRLNLISNTIQSWSGDLFAGLPELAYLDLRNNTITIINESSVSALSQLSSDLSLDLSGNPFDCYCELIWFRGWMNNTNITLVNKNKYICASPSNMIRSKVLDFDPKDIHYKCYPPYLIIGICVAIGVVLFIVIICVLYRKRYRVQLWYYRQQKRENREEYSRLPESMKYVISYAEADKEWVEGNMLCKLEAKFQEKHLYHREQDQEFGERDMSFTNKLIDASVLSRRTLVVLSVRYLHDPFYCFELTELIDALIKNDKLDNLVLILLEVKASDEIKIRDKMPKSLRRVVESDEQLWVWKADDESAQTLCLERVVGMLQETVPLLGQVQGARTYVNC